MATSSSYTRASLGRNHLGQLPVELVDFSRYLPDADCYALRSTSRFMSACVSAPRRINYDEALIAIKDVKDNDGDWEHYKAPSQRASERSVSAIALPPGTIVDGPTVRKLKMKFPELRTFEHEPRADSDVKYRFDWLPTTRSTKSTKASGPPGIIYKYTADGESSLVEAKKNIPRILELQCSAAPGSNVSNREVVSDALSLIYAHHSVLCGRYRLPRIVTMDFNDATVEDYCRIATGDSKYPDLIYGEDGNGAGAVVLTSGGSCPSLSGVLAAKPLWGSSKVSEDGSEVLEERGLASRLRRVVIDATINDEPLSLPSAPPSKPFTNEESRLREVTFRLRYSLDGRGSSPEGSVFSKAREIAKAFDGTTTRYPRFKFEPHPEDSSPSLAALCSETTGLVISRRATFRSSRSLGVLEMPG